MILRKPYSFLIRNLKKIHIIMFVINLYLITRTNVLLTFFNEYIDSNSTLIGSNVELINSFSYAMIIIMFLLSSIIFFLMKLKDNKALFYFICIILYIFSFIMYSYDNNVINDLAIKVIDIRTIKMASDLTLILFLIQIFVSIIFLIRGLGFNLKKFDFDKELELEITENDKEEFELNVEFDKNKFRRNINKNTRNLKYIYHENKFLINIFICILILISSIIVYLNINVFNKIYKQNEVITTTNYNYQVLESFVLNKNYRGNIITDNYIVAVKLKIKNITDKRIQIEPTRYQIKIGKIYYNSTTKYNNKLSDIGKSYNNEKISTEDDFIILFEIPKKNKTDKMILKYLDTNNKVYNTKLSNSDFEKQTVVNSKLNEDIVINNKLYNNIRFKILNYNINNEFKSEYTFCETKNKCYNSKEYIVPSLTDNYIKTILKIEATSDISKLINLYGQIEYKIKDDVKIMSTPLLEIIPRKSKEKNVYYFEIYEDIKNADTIDLILNIRNSKYIYNLK